MTIHIAPPDRPELDDSFALWRSQYPKYGALIDEGAPPLTCIALQGRLADVAQTADFA